MAFGATIFFVVRSFRSNPTGHSERVEEVAKEEEVKEIGIERAKLQLNKKVENIETIENIQINSKKTQEYVEVEVTYEVIEDIGTKEKIKI